MSGGSGSYIAQQHNRLCYYARVSAAIILKGAAPQSHGREQHDLCVVDFGWVYAYRLDCLVGKVITYDCLSARRLGQIVSYMRCVLFVIYTVLVTAQS